MMTIWHGRSHALAVLLVVGACTSEPGATGTTTSSSTAPSETTSPTPAVRDIMELDYFVPLEPGTYSIDPDVDPATPLRVEYEIPTEGWSRWIGAAKLRDDGHVGVSITTVDNLVAHGCSDHSWAEPPVGPSVDDLATALANLAPFTLTSPPEDVTVDGYRGTHLELTVPELPVSGDGADRAFTGCDDEDLRSWVAPIDTTPGDAFYGYTGGGYVEELWILDVEGTRLMISAGVSPGSPSEHVEEMRSILDSIRIAP